MAGIEVLTLLQRLDVMENNMTDPAELMRLTSMAALQDVHIRRNPFTKTHPAYRLTIFNIFRSTPGSSGDIMIDSSGPSYAERRHLVERAREAEQQLMPQRSPDGDNHGESATSGQVAVMPSAPVSNADQDSNHLSAGQDGEGRPTKRRKQPRRRIVDLSAETTPQTPESIASTQSNRLYMTAKEQQNPDARKPARFDDEELEIDSARNRSTARVGKGMVAAETPSQRPRETTGVDKIRSTQQSDSISQSNDLYRRRIQALKSEPNSAWLSPLETKISEPTTTYNAFDTSRERPMPTAERV